MMRHVTCEVCGLGYIEPDDNREHDRVHSRFVALSEQYAVPKFGPLLWAWGERESSKGALDTVEDGERRLYAWFCRSVEACGDSQHPSFPDYAAIMIENGIPGASEDILRDLATLYRRRTDNHEHIEPGKSYWQSNSRNQGSQQ
jgi:hypothetical protein